VPPPAPEAALPPQDPPISDSERAILLELRQRREQLEAREVTLATREAVLTATERKLSGRVEELQALQKKLEALDASRAQREDAGWQGLVKLYETMKPRDAATIMNELDMQVLLQVLDRMREGKAALILSAMHPDRAREVTDGLAHLRVRDTSAARDRG
jgi:flagellar motility protein MotE (MotC chaperone)